MPIRMKSVRYLLLVPLFSSSPIQPQELRLDQAVQLALQDNRDLANATLDVNKADDRLAALRTRLLPSINVYALGGQQLRSTNFTIDRGALGNFASTGPVPSRDVTFSTPLRPTGVLVSRVAQPLSTLHRIRLNVQLLNIS